MIDVILIRLTCLSEHIIKTYIYHAKCSFIGLTLRNTKKKKKKSKSKFCEAYLDADKS